MPERIIEIITGNLPNLLMPISWDTWNTYEITAGRDKFIVEIVRMYDRTGSKIMDIGVTIECDTYRYQNRLGGWMAAIKFPKEICQKYGIRLSHYIEVNLLKIKRNNIEMDIFPKRDVFEQYPFWYKKVYVQE